MLYPSDQSNTLHTGDRTGAGTTGEVSEVSSSTWGDINFWETLFCKCLTSSAQPTPTQTSKPT